MRANTANGCRPSVGERIELRRRRRHLSRRLVAELVGRSEEWLRLVETGRLRLDNVQSILRLAEVLQIEDYRELIEWPVREVRPATDAAQDLIDLIEPALVDHPAIGAYTSDSHQRIDRNSVQWLAAEIDRCEKIWTGSPQRYVLLAQRLPHLLTTCHAVYWRREHPGAEGLLARSYRLSREVLTTLGAHHLAVLAADRALVLARDIDDPRLFAVSGWHWAAALLHLEHHRHCHVFALATAENAISNTGCADDVAIIGALRVLAAKGVAGSDPTESGRLLENARQLAHTIGADRRVLGIGFGHCEIGLARMEIALSRNEFGTAIDAAAEVDPLDALPIGRRARYFIALAAAYAGRSEIVSAAFALSEAAETCPDELRYDPDAHSVLRRIIKHENRLLGPRIEYLADLAGIG